MSQDLPGPGTLGGVLTRTADVGSTPSSSASSRVAARAPQTHVSCSGVQLVVEHVAGVSVVGFDDQEPRVALLQELAFVVAAVEVDVREATAVDVVALDVVLQPHHLTEQPRRRVCRGLRSVALHRLAWMMRLRSAEAAPTSPTHHPGGWVEPRVLSWVPDSV